MKIMIIFTPQEVQQNFEIFYEFLPNIFLHFLLWFHFKVNFEISIDSYAKNSAKDNRKGFKSIAIQ